MGHTTGYVWDAQTTGTGRLSPWRVPLWLPWLSTHHPVARVFICVAPGMQTRPVTSFVQNGTGYWPELVVSEATVLYPPFNGWKTSIHTCTVMPLCAFGHEYIAKPVALPGVDMSGGLGLMLHGCRSGVSKTSWPALAEGTRSALANKATATTDIAFVLINSSPFPPA